MEARDIYHMLKIIVKPIHAHDDQMVAIAKWIEAEFEYKPHKQAYGVNTSERQLTIPNVSDKVCPYCGHNSVLRSKTGNMCKNCNKGW